MMGASDNAHLYQRYARLKPPLTPNEEVVSAIAFSIAGHDARVLILGMTPSLLPATRTAIVIEKDEKMIATAWPGDTDAAKATMGDWFSVPTPVRPFTAVIGDGSLIYISLTDYPVLLGRLAQVLSPGARLAIRIYETPEAGETPTEVRSEAYAGKIMGFHALKWRLAMSLVTKEKSSALPVARIHAVFEDLFPDRTRLSRVTGWSIEDIAEIDAYRDRGTAYHFPKRQEILAVWPKIFGVPQFIPSGSYELAERCPILIADYRP
jgi:hypothetical protein